MHPISFRIKWFVPLALALVLLVSACTPEGNVSQSAQPENSSVSLPAAASTPVDEANLQVGGDPSLGQPDVSFTLQTGIVDSKMAFIGVGGEIDGVTNPELHVAPGQVVEVKLVDGEGAMHDFAIPEQGVITKQITGQGSEASLVFKADQAGRYSYYCTIPGHRQAGMEGLLVVGDAAQADIVTTSVVHAPDDLPGPITRSTPGTVRVDLEAKEVQARLADGTSYTFWTFNGQVPGPFIRVRVGDTVEVHLKNDPSSTMNHSVDFHAVTGPGGGAVATQTKPGDETSFSFQALHAGLFVYHCATPMVAQHISNGMYGMVLVEPEAGLSPVDREFYVMQGEIYTAEKMGEKGADSFSVDKLLDEQPEYFIMNGAVGALTTEHPLKAQVGETVRIFYGVGGPNFVSSFHVIGESFDKVYDQASLTSAPLTDVQTTLVPPGGATIVEFHLDVPGRYILVDHSLSRMERGLAGYLMVDGPENPEIFNNPNPPAENSGH